MLAFCVNWTYPLHCWRASAKNSVKSMGRPTVRGSKAMPVQWWSLLVHDNATVSALPEWGSHWCDWVAPPASLNPIEHLWDVMCRCSQCRYVPPRAAEELTDALIKVWWEIPQETIAHVSGSTLRCCSECIQAYGAHTLMSHIAGYLENIYGCWITVYLRVHITH